MKKRALSFILCLAMCFSLFSPCVSASDETGTKDVTSMLTHAELVGVEKDADGTYHVPANQQCSIRLTFQEDAGHQMDMSDYVQFPLPEGVLSDGATSTIEIGVNDAGVYKPISHRYTVSDNIVTIFWNKDDESFEDLFRSPVLYFDFDFQATFDGSKDEVHFGGESGAVVKVDNTGSITIHKTITGLKPDVTLTDEQMQAMTFELRNSDNETVKTFTYADMADGSITYSEMKPGEYSVVETAHPDFTNYTFDTTDSVTTKVGTLPNGGVLTLPMSNDYDYDTGNLELTKIIHCTNWDYSTTVPDSIKGSISFTVTGPNGFSKTIPYTSFTDGKYLLSGLEVGEYTVTETNAVTGYSCTYKVNHVSAETPVASAEITKGTTAAASFENTYTEKAANLTIKKTASGTTVPANTKFTVTFPDGTTKTFKYSDMTDGEYVFSHVPLGSYSVKEDSTSAKVEHYSLKTSGTGSIALSKDTTKTIKNTYTPIGDLAVKKTISGDLTSDDLTDEQKKAMVFTVVDSSGKVKGALTYEQVLSGKKLTALPEGTYTVIEGGADIPGYTVTTSPFDGEATVTVSKDKVATASFTNKYVKDEYKLTVVKQFADGSYYDLSSLPDDIKENTTFTVEKGSEVVASCKLADLETTLNGLILTDAGPYTVTETNPAVTGISISASVSKNGGTFKSGTSTSVTLVNHEPATITFKNDYTLQGMIKGDKTVAGLDDYDESLLRNRITFSIYREQGGVYSVYKDNVSLADLEAGIIVPSGNYYVQETGSVGVDGYEGPDVKTRVEDGEEKEGSNTKNFTVAKSDTVTVHFTNTYTTGIGSGTMKLIKYVKGLDEIGSPDEIELTNALNVHNTTGDLLYDGVQFSFEILVDGKWHHYNTYSLSEFVHGILFIPGHYRITELRGAVEGYDLHVDYLIKSEGEGGTERVSNESIEFDITSSQTLEVEAHNVYTKLGNLKITKKTEGGLTAAGLGATERNKIVFKVTGPFGFDKSFTYNDFYSSGVKEFKNIPVGTYTITETAGDTTNYVLTVHSSLTGSNAPKSGAVIIPVGGTAQVDFTNTYSQKTGKLTIQKTLAGEAPETLTEAQKKAMKFEVYSGSTVKYTVTYDQFVDGSYTFDKVPIGKYTVKETVGEALTNDYDIAITGNNAAASISYGKTSTVAIKNTFTKTGALKLVKTFAGVTIPNDKKDTIQFKYWKLDAENQKIGSGTTVNYSDFTGSTYTVKNLELGNYIVEELDDTTGYKRSVTVKVDSGTAAEGTSATAEVAFGTPVTVTFTNTYAEVSSLKITKSIAGALKIGNLTEKQKKAITFTVTDSKDAEVASFSLFEMGSGKVIEDLTPGEYTVTETINDPDRVLFGDYTCATKYKIGTASAQNGASAKVTAVHGENAVAFTNTYTKIDPLKVVKSSSKTHVGMATIENANYPVWRFTLAISNLNPLTTKDGTTTFTDVFDTKGASSLFRLATAEEVKAALGHEEKNAYITSTVAGKPAPTAVFDEYDNKIIISGITSSTADKCDFVYYLIVKDRSALKMLNTPEAENLNGVERNFNNEITYHPMPHKPDTKTTAAEYEYSFTAVSKEITNLDDQGNLYQMAGTKKLLVSYADYSVTLNESGVTIGDEPTITAIDTFSENQTVLLSSIKTDPTDGVSYTLNNEEHKIVFTIPNSTPVTVSYRITIIKDPDSSQSTVRLQNNIDILGFVDKVDKNVKCSLGGEGQGMVYSLRLNKVDSLDNSLKLEGVKFALYDGETNEHLTDGITNASGQILFKYWGTKGALIPDRNYYVEEVNSIRGYSLNSEKIWFRVTDSAPGRDGNVSIVTNGGDLVVTNKAVATFFEVTKSFNDWSKQGSFSFRLKALEGAPMPATGGDFAVATEADPVAKFGLIRFPVTDGDVSNDKVVTYHYTIQEIDSKIAGVTYDTTVYPVTVVISDHDKDGIKEIAVSYGTDNKDSLTITNSYDEGILSVSKEVKGNDIESDRAFTFTITLDHKLTGTYGDVEFTNGKATLTLKDGDSLDIEGLPNGTVYTVTEADYSSDGYKSSYPGGYVGTVSKDTPAVVRFTNTRNTYGKLNISKVLAGNDTDSSKKFTFTVTLEPAISGTFSDVVFTDGVASVTLKGGESKTIEGLPNGIKYTVKEADYSAAGYTTASTGDTGTIVGNSTCTAAFTNTRNTFGDLKVTKAVAGNAGSSTKDFSFTVTLTDKSISGTYGDMTFENGVATFTLKDGGSKKATGLPNGTEYTVTEASYTADGYETTKTGASGKIAGNQTKTAAFTNTRNANGSLAIFKKLAGNDTDSTKSFTFTITLNSAISGTFSGVVFTNGVATIALKGGESKTIEGLPNGTGYTVTEADYSGDGYVTTSVGRIGTISETAVSKATFTNTRNTYGDLKVTKTVAGNAGSTTKKFSFTVELSDKSISGAYGEMDFENGVATFTLKDGETKKATGLPNGTEYTVTEASYSADGYTTSKTGNVGKIVGNQTKTAAFTNTRNAEGSLTVSKTLVGNDTDSAKNFTFTVTLDPALSGTYSGVVFTDGVATVTLKGGESKTIEGLPNRSKYTVKEADYSGAGYKTTSTGAAGTISETAVSVAAFTNTRNTYGKLTVSKTLAGNATDSTKDFTFTITLDPALSGTYSGVVFTSGVATVTLKGGESKTIEGLPNGTKYSVTEANYTSDGYVTTSTGSSGTIVGNSAYTAAFTNTRNTYGELKVTKTVAGNAGSSTKAFSFTVTLSDTALSGTYGDMTFTSGVATFTLKDGESKTAKGLPNGVGYTVTEADYTADGYVTAKVGDSGTIIGGTSLTAAFTNTRNAEGSLTVSKTLAGNDTDSTKDFTFTIKLASALSGTYSGISFTGGVATVTLKGGESRTIEGLPNGTKYTVAEADYTGDGYTTTSTGSSGTISETAVSVAAFTNTRNTYGDLVVTKTVDGNACSTAKEFSFTVTLTDKSISGAYGGMSFVNGVATFTLKGGESKTAKDLPNGVGYTVTEADYTADGYVTAKTGDSSRIIGNDTLTAAFTNTRNAEGSLTVSKTLAGNDTDSAKDFTFTITLDAALSGTYSGVAFTDGVATIALKGGESKTIEGLPNGTGYTVKEANYSPDGYVTTMSGNAGTIDENAPAVAAFTNTRNTYGDLIVSKTVDGNACSTAKEFSFAVELSDKTVSGTYGDMSFVSGVAVFTLKHGESKKAEGLPNGVSYTVTETDYTADGYVTAKTGDSGKIVGDRTITAAFTNTRNAEGSLTVSKTLNGNDTDSTKDFTFTIKLDAALSGTYSGIVFIDGVAVITLKGGESKTIEGLPNGTGYTVSEADYTADGYVTTMSGDAGTIDEHVPAVAAFTNTRSTYGDLVVTKTVAGNAGNGFKSFTFTVELSDTTISGTYGDMSFVNGVATFTLRHGEHKTATGLPNGVGYTVTEADYTSNGYVVTMTGDTGIIVGDSTLTAAFTNTKNFPGDVSPESPIVPGPEPGPEPGPGSGSDPESEPGLEPGPRSGSDPESEPASYGTLTISKNVTGDLGDKTKDFTFTVVLDAGGSFSYTGSRSGTITSGGTVQLKHGESITITGIPAGTFYTVTESGSAGYTVYVSGGSGRVSGGKTSTAKFTNTRSSVPKTGDNSNLPLWYSLMGLSGIGMLCSLIIGKKKNRKPYPVKNK